MLLKKLQMINVSRSMFVKQSSTFLLKAGIVLCSMASLSYADFEVQKEYCTISNKFVGMTSDNIEYDGIVNISFTNDNVLLPVININLSRNIKPTDMSITWPTVKLVDSQNRPLFEREFQARLESEKTNVFKFKKESYSFYSQPYGFYRLQHFISLFLSQNDFTINFKNEESGTQESQVVPLAGSDMAFREMTYLCYKDKVSDYINENLTRKKVVHESWAIGYGISNFYKYEEALPEEVKFPNEMTAALKLESIEGYKLLSDLYPMLVSKVDLLSEISTLDTREDYVTLKTSIDANADKVLQLNKQIEDLGGNNGSIKRLELEIEGLDSSIKTTSDSIQVYENNLDPLEEKTEVLKIKIEELRAQLRQFEQKIALAQEQSAASESNIKFLNNVLETYIAEYTSSDLMTVDEKALSTPFSIESIKESDAKIKEQIEKRIELTQVISLVEAISGYVNTLVEDHKLALGVFNQMSELKLKRVSLQESYTQAQLNEIEVHRAVGGISFEAISARINEEKKDSTLKGIKNADIKKRYLDAIRTNYGTYDKYLEEIQASDRNILAKILCKSDSFLRSFRGQCFNPIEAKDAKKIEIYVDQLDSTDISFLGSLVTGENSMVQKYDSNLVQLISSKMSQEVNSETTNEAITLWEDILFVRWAYYAVRNLDDEGIFNFDSLTNTLNVQKEELNKIIKEQERLTTDIVEVDFNISSLNKKFLENEAKYFASLDENQGYILGELVARSSVHPADVNLKCLLEISNIDACAADVNKVQSETSTSLKSLSEDIKKSVVLLVLTSQKQLTELQTTLNKAVTEMNNTINEKDSFIVSSDYKVKNEEFETANGELNRQRLRLKSLYEQKADAEQKRLAIMSERNDIKLAHTSLTDEMKALVGEMQPTLVKLKPICDEQNKNIADLNKVEGQILNLLEIKRNPIPVNSLCQIQF